MEAPVVLSPEEVAQAIAVRREFGLREDEAWVRAVAANPTAVMDFGVPLMPFERDEIMRRPNGEEGITAALQDYLAEHADVSGGLYIDQARGGIVTILVTDDPAPHQAALAELLGADAPVAVRQVRWTEAELNDLQERISADQAFLASLPAQMKSSGVFIIDNIVELSISSAVPDAGERIAAHFGAQRHAPRGLRRDRDPAATDGPDPRPRHRPARDGHEHALATVRGRCGHRRA